METTIGCRRFRRKPSALGGGVFHRSLQRHGGAIPTRDKRFQAPKRTTLLIFFYFYVFFSSIVLVELKADLRVLLFLISLQRLMFVFRLLYLNEGADYPCVCANYLQVNESDKDPWKWKHGHKHFCIN